MLKKFKNLFIAEKETSMQHAETEAVDCRNPHPKSSPKSFHAQQKYVKKTVINVQNNTNGVISQGNKVVNVYNGVGRRIDSDEENIPGVHIGSTPGFSDTDYNRVTEYGRQAPRSYEAKNRKTSRLNQNIASCTLELSVDNKYLIADNLGERWKRFARMLPEANFTDADIYSFEQNNFGAQVEAVICVLNRWGERAPDYATVGEVAKVLEKIGLLDIANKLTTE